MSTLQTAIEHELAGVSTQALAEAAEGLTGRYREAKRTARQFMAENIDRSAYIAYRMPATYAVVCRVLEELKLLMPETLPKTLLDLGSGPGTALWAACEMLPTIEQVKALENDAQLIALGKRLASHADLAMLQHAVWQQQDLAQLESYPQADLIIASYALGELTPEEQIKAISGAWQATTQTLVLIEPGTPEGFKRILAWRTWLIANGAYLVAPCPHMAACPMAGSDWCHFSQRLSRSSLHRQLKGASLGHEDEKYSYLIASKIPYQSDPEVQGRILRHPQKHSGHLELTLCTDHGAIKKTISRRDGALYKIAKKLEWGDLLKK